MENNLKVGKKKTKIVRKVIRQDKDDKKNSSRIIFALDHLDSIESIISIADRNNLKIVNWLMQVDDTNDNPSFFGMKSFNNSSNLENYQALLELSEQVKNKTNTSVKNKWLNSIELIGTLEHVDSMKKELIR